MQRIRTLLLVIIVLALVALAAGRLLPRLQKNNDAVTGRTEATTPSDGALAGKGLRFDGYYMETRGDLLYLLRFFPEGRAVLVNGTSDLRDQLSPLLVRDAKGDPAIGWYNVPVKVDGDSLFFTTRPEKGTIDYAGGVVDGSTVRFLRISNINGTRQLKEYIFQPDGSKQ